MKWTIPSRKRYIDTIKKKRWPVAASRHAWYALGFSVPWRYTTQGCHRERKFVRVSGRTGVEGPLHNRKVYFRYRGPSTPAAKIRPPSLGMTVKCESEQHVCTPKCSVTLRSPVRAGLPVRTPQCNPQLHSPLRSADSPDTSALDHCVRGNCGSAR